MPKNISYVNIYGNKQLNGKIIFNNNYSNITTIIVNNNSLSGLLDFR